MSAGAADRLTVLCVINSLGPSGAERSLAELVPHYLENAIRPIIVCLREKGTSLESAIRSMGCELRTLPSGTPAARIRALRRMIVRDNAHLVHTTLFDSDIVGRLASMGTGVPVLTSLVNTAYDPARLEDPNVGRAALWVTRLSDAWTARYLTSHFHAITEAVKASAVRALKIPADRVTVIERGRARARLGSPDPRRRLDARKRLGIDDTEAVILNVGRQEYQKGQKYLLQAAALLAHRGRRFVVLLCGREGHASRELRELSRRLDLGGRVRMLGNQDAVPELLCAADVFAFPSVYEGLGGAVIEAMALGLPVVASDVPALREVVEDGRNGFLVTPRSPAALAAALARVLDDRALAAAFGTRSIRIFEERFTLERSATRMVELCRRVARGKGAV